MPMTCDEVFARLSEYVDGELPDALTAEVEAHLQSCENCRKIGDAFCATLEVLKTHLRAGDRAPASLRARLKAALG